MANSLRLRNTPLHGAANSGNLAVLQQLLQRDPDQDLEVRGKGGWTPLHVAVYKGHLPIVTALLKAGALVHSEMLYTACEYGYAVVARTLVLAGATPDFRDAKGRSPFDLPGATEFVRELRELSLLDESESERV